MRANSSPRPLVAAANGTSAASRHRGAGTAGEAAPDLAPFAAWENAVANPEMWPAQPVVWLRPELRPGVPPASGLRIERRFWVPAPDFLPLAPAPASLLDALQHESDPLPPHVRQTLPASDLAPLGWDPRAVSGKEPK